MHNEDVKFPLCVFFFQALNDAKKELRFLLVYLHSSEHQDTDEFCRYVTFIVVKCWDCQIYKYILNFPKNSNINP